MENNTAKHFVLQLGSLASLYLSLSFLLVLIFGLINMALPDAADSYWEAEREAEGIKIGIAMVVVFFPTYITLTRIVNQNRRKSSEHSYLGLTKWLIYLSLLVGGAVLLGDLVAVIMAYLNGDITTRFVLKAAAVLVVVGGAFGYYLKDVKGQWLEKEKASKTFALVVTILVVSTVIYGITRIESPKDAREVKIDNEQIADLQELQWQISDYLAINGVLPENLEQMEEVHGARITTAPDGRSNYSYQVTEKGFELCATFSTESDLGERYYGRPYPAESVTPTILNPDNWQHGAGEHCFERVVK